MLMKNARLLYILGMILALHACEDEGTCTTDLTARVNAGFYVRDGAAGRDTTLSLVTFYGLSRPDSLLYDAASGVKKLEFPLPPAPAEFTRFVLKVDTLCDTIKLWHLVEFKLVSYACGFSAFHNIYYQSHDDDIIDSIAITNPHVDLTDEENLRIYINPVVADTAR